MRALHFWSRDEDGGYNIRSAVPENPMLHPNITALCLTQVIADGSFTMWE